MLLFRFLASLYNLDFTQADDGPQAFRWSLHVSPLPQLYCLEISLSFTNWPIIAPTIDTSYIIILATE